MAFLYEKQKQNIAEAIRAAESRTSGELVAVIAHNSDDYFYIPLLWAALSALILPGALLWFDVTSASLEMMQVATFVVAAVVFRLPLVKMRLIPRYVRQRRAALLAREQFLLQNLHHTEQRNGILLFVSVAERYVELIADKGISEAVPLGTWDTVVQQFIEHVGRHQIETGFITAIQQCGDILEQHFPVTDKDSNELPNHLIEIRTGA
jgi:putative membrane protein